VAPCIGTLSRHLERDAVPRKALYNRLDPEELGRPRLVLKLDLDASTEQPWIDVLPHAHADIRRDAQLVRGLQDQV